MEYNLMGIYQQKLELYFDRRSRTGITSVVREFSKLPRGTRLEELKRLMQGLQEKLDESGGKTPSVEAVKRAELTDALYEAHGERTAKENAKRIKKGKKPFPIEEDRSKRYDPSYAIIPHALTRSERLHSHGEREI